MIVKPRFVEILNDELKNESNKIDVEKFGELDLSVEYFDEILKFRDQVSECISEIKKKMKRAPAGRLRVNAHGGIPHFFHMTNQSDSHGDYIPKKKLKLAESLAQKAADEKDLKKLEELLGKLNKFIKTCDPVKFNQMYLNLSPARRSLVTPVRYPDKMFEEIWSSVDYIKKPFEPDSAEIYTHERLRVRSKSEVIIAETLERLKIPFRYECPLKLKGFGVVHPDFVCLDARRRCVHIWEHFGMVDKSDYAENMVRKISAYNDNGFLLGDGLIITCETALQPLNANRLNSFVMSYFKKERAS